MLTITKPAANRIDIDLGGKLTADTMRAALEELLQHSENIENGKMLYTIPEFAMPTLGALGVELAYMPRMFSLLGKFDKCAVLSDAGWIRNAAEVEGALFPGIAIKAFALDDREGAETWLALD